MKMSITCVLTEKETLQDFIARSESTVQKEEEEHVRHAELVAFDNCSKGLGIKICGGCSLNGEEDYGIFIKRILPGGLADLDGRLQKGDQILEVNKESLEGVTNERAVAILRQASASNHVEIIVARDDQARSEFREILEKSNGFSFPCTPVSIESQEKSESLKKPPQQKEKLHISSTSLVWSTQNKENLIKRNHQSVTPGRSPSNASIEIQEHRITPIEDENTVNMHSPIRHHTRALLLPSMTSTPHAKGTSHQSCSTLSQEMPSSVTVHSTSFESTAKSVFETKSPSKLPNYWTMSHSKKLSLDPLERVKVENCEMALCYLGLEPTSEQQIELRSHLQIDANGTVVYGDFVNAARDVFRLELEEKNIGASALFFADVADPPAYKSEVLLTLKRERTNSFVLDSLSILHITDELFTHDTLLREKEGASRKAEEETLKIRLKAQEAIQLSRMLRSKFHLAEQAQQVARDVEQDYEEVVHLLEGEVAQLQAQLNKQRLSDPIMQRRLAVLTCQLQKSEARQKVYEVAVEKLLQFAEHVHETLNEQSDTLGTKSTGNLGEAPRGTCPPGYLGKHKGQSSKSLATEAREIVKTVKAVIDNQPLPFGWEEAYTSDGMKYYINHLNQVTTWSHPMSSVQHLPTVKDDKKSTNRPPDQPS
ncbi:hypothetical protein CHS0354_028035 [Potamilus streckersoni]|uniref:Syntaxin-binding protein 4 n=1 Tax=Potamilus streckersoni TaxID=2493646 RepID=A0AAE0THW4_9BIVA|nr:hypothetical protein CHS0354_028035 [Potamilus streckersoni]